jgi:hypothetical protein
MPDAPDRLRDCTLADGSPAYFVSLAAYAAARTNPDTGKPFTRAVASKWNKLGQIVWVDDDERDGKQLIDAAASDTARNDYQNPLKRQAPAPGAFTAPLLHTDDAAPPEPTQPASDPAPDDEDADRLETATSAPPPTRDPMQDTVSRAKAHGAVLDAKMKELGYKERLRELVPMAELRFREIARMSSLRDALLQLPGLVAEEANPDSPGRARKAISDGVTRLLDQYIAEARSDLIKEAQAAHQAATERADAKEPSHA